MTMAVTCVAADGELTIVDVRKRFRAWLRDHDEDLAAFCELPTDVDAVFATLSRLQHLLFNAGWIRLGWEEDLGGLGGPMALRGVVSEELAAAGYPPPFSFGTQEVLGPAVARYASPELARSVLPRLLQGEETWCQGFSEPGAGSDLGSLRMRAVDDGEFFRVSGEKIWTSWAQYTDRCMLLTRTGTPESAHRGITAMFVDMDSPGITVSPLVAMTGEADFCSLYFDDVLVPKDRVLGRVGGGWSIAMFILSCERGVAAWQRQAWMRWRLGRLVEEAPALTDARAGESFELVHALRLLSRRTLRSLSDGETLGSRPSFDKLLMSTAEKYLFDAALEALPETLLLDDERSAQDWRNDYLYSRASSIYGGAAEVQRNIIAEYLLGLPRG
jgi:alkylation response protein AidB-like acyl-CoA dehydrogenase